MTDVGPNFFFVCVIGFFLVLLALVGCAASFWYQPQIKIKTKEGFLSRSIIVFIAFELAVGILVYGSFQVATIAQQSCTSALSAPANSTDTKNIEHFYDFRVSGANMTCEKGESNYFVLALQGGRRCVQYIRPDLADGGNWQTSMRECNIRGGYSPHFYNSIDVYKMSEWIPRLLKTFITMPQLQGWAGHKASSPEAWASRNMTEIAWYIDLNTTIGITLDMMEQNHISWEPSPFWWGDKAKSQFGQFYILIDAFRGQPYFFENGIAQNVFCEYENPKYVAEFTNYESKRSPAPVFESQEASSNMSCDQICLKYKHCMGFNEISIANDKYRCDLVAFIKIDLVNATLIDDQQSTYYDLVVD